jgi:drug/metabolite transporter (DMT)-like permease
LSGYALALLLTAACLHVGWNVLLKGATDRTIVSWWALACGSALFLPVLAMRPALPSAVWPIAALSAAIEAVYYLLLARAYAMADFSQAYPLARGAAPVFLAVWSALLLREVPSALGATGIALIAFGLATIGAGGLGGRGLRTALAVGLCTSVYSLIDGYAVRRADAAAYTIIVLGLTALFLAPVVLIRHGGATALAAWRGQVGRIVTAGALQPLGYMLVLSAYTMTSLAYAASVREVSVVIGALVGWRLLKEPFGARRVAGSAAVLAGIVVLALGGA